MSTKASYPNYLIRPTPARSAQSNLRILPTYSQIHQDLGEAYTAWNSKSSSSEQVNLHRVIWVVTTIFPLLLLRSVTRLAPLCPPMAHPPLTLLNLLRPPLLKVSLIVALPSAPICLSTLMVGPISDPGVPFRASPFNTIWDHSWAP
jgi:hypothetical protein